MGEHAGSLRARLRMMGAVRALRPGDLIAIVLVTLALIVAGIVAAERAAPPDYADTYSTHDSDRGGYLAVRRLLEREGIRVVESNRHPRFLSADRLILVGIGSYAKIDVDELRDFVAKRGKTLVVIGDYDPYARKTLGLPKTRETPVRTTYGAVPIIASPYVSGVDRIVGEGTTRIVHTAFPAVVPIVADSSGAILATYGLGRGHIVVLIDPTIFANRLLDRADNARFAANVLGAGPNTTVAFDEFVHGYGRTESAWLVLPSPLRIAILIATAACLVALLGSAIRFVPAAAAPVVRDPNSAAYLASLAILLRRGRAATRARADLIDATFASIARAFGLPAHTDPNTLAALAQAQAGAPGRIRELAALRARSSVDEAHLLHAAQLCAELRKELDTDGTQRRAAAR